MGAARASMVKILKAGSETTADYDANYAAWNRLTHVSANSDHNPTIATYRYDGLGRRISKAIAGGDTFHYYYNENWQVLEVTKGSAAYEQYVWDARYIDAPVLRDRDTNSDAEDGFEERLYYLTDANMNVTAMVDVSGNVVERYRYDAYGKVTFLAGTKDLTGNPTAEWTVRNASIADNQVLYCGYRFDPETGLYQVRYRMLHPTAGRWLQRDPAGYVDGMGLYEYVRAGPLTSRDPTAMEANTCMTVTGAQTGPLWSGVWVVTNMVVEPGKYSGGTAGVGDRMGILMQMGRQLAFYCDATDTGYYRWLPTVQVATARPRVKKTNDAYPATNGLILVTIIPGYQLVADLSGLFSVGAGFTQRVPTHDVPRLPNPATIKVLPPAAPNGYSIRTPVTCSNGCVGVPPVPPPTPAGAVPPGLRFPAVPNWTLTPY
mgnify:CR=1 FL=1